MVERRRQCGSHGRHDVRDACAARSSSSGYPSRRRGRTSGSVAAWSGLTTARKRAFSVSNGEDDAPMRSERLTAAFTQVSLGWEVSRKATNASSHRTGSRMLNNKAWQAGPKLRTFWLARQRFYQLRTPSTDSLSLTRSIKTIVQWGCSWDTRSRGRRLWAALDQHRRDGDRAGYVEQQRTGTTWLR